MSKYLRRIVLLAAVVVGVVGLGGCAEEQESCDSTTACSQSIQACCTSSQCKYNVAGRTFPCNGTNCDAAATQAANAACGRGANPDAVASLVRKAAESALAAQTGSSIP